MTRSGTCHSWTTKENNGDSPGHVHSNSQAPQLQREGTSGLVGAWTHVRRPPC